MDDKRIVMIKLRHSAEGQIENYEEVKKDYLYVNVTSGNRNEKIVKDLSPFFIGPVKTGDGLTAACFESFWQFSKVYPCHIGPDGLPNKSWFKWREEGFKLTGKATRHPKGMRARDCVYSYYFIDGKWQKLGYVESRKKIYMPEYAKLVVNTDTFKELKKHYDNGGKLLIADFDAWNYYGRKFELTTTIKDVINDSRYKAGHGYAIKMLLEGDIEVDKSGKVIDKSGILK